LKIAKAPREGVHGEKRVRRDRHGGFAAPQ
jgi:hypothetical protein